MSSIQDGQTATIERMRHAAGRVDNRLRDLKTNRAADRIVPAFELLRRRSQISREEAEAGENYATFWHGARSTPGLVSSYGQQRWSGTTAGQADTESIMKEEWPIYCAQKLADARHAIRDGAMIQALDRVVELDSTLEDIGRAWRSFGSVQQARASGLTILSFALSRLAVHYGYLRARPPQVA